MLWLIVAAGVLVFGIITMIAAAWWDDPPDVAYIKRL